MIMALSESPDPTGGWTAEQEEQKEIVRLIGKIPVRNLYLLMLYASEFYRECGRAWTAVEDNPDNIPDLVGEILCGCVEKRLRRRLNYGYQTFREPLSRVRGRIDFLRTYRHNLLAKGKVTCVFEDMVVDTARNRLVRTALEKMAALVKRTDLACRCRALVATMQAMGVTGPCPTRYAISLERFGRHDAEDVPMVTAARLALELALPTEDPGASLLPSPEREKHWVRRLFERGIAGLYAAALGKDWDVVHGERLKWPVTDCSQGMCAILPGMVTDIVLTNKDQGRRIIIDTKFNSLLKKGRYGNETLRSHYIYQMYAYLRSQEGRGTLYDTAEGILLHPSVGESVDEHIIFQGHRMRFVTVDLAASARDIRKRLLQIICEG